MYLSSLNESKREKQTNIKKWIKINKEYLSKEVRASAKDTTIASFTLAVIEKMIEQVREFLDDLQTLRVLYESLYEDEKKSKN